MRRRGLAGWFLLLGLVAGSDPALAASFRLVDEDGVVHFTNAPTDPRYRHSTELTGATSGWLQLPSGRSGRYAAEIREAASRYGIDAKLVEALIWTESTFDPWAVSRKGAQGLMQLMPGTASLLGVREPFNPRQNIDGGVRHLRALLDRYQGSLPLALAAYNAGDEAVRSHRGVPPYPETQGYVRKILQLYGADAHQTEHSQTEHSEFVYRYEDAQGSVTYTNIPSPRGTAHLR